MKRIILASAAVAALSIAAPAYADTADVKGNVSENCEISNLTDATLGNITTAGASANGSFNVICNGYAGSQIQVASVQNGLQLLNSGDAGSTGENIGYNFSTSGLSGAGNEFNHNFDYDNGSTAEINQDYTNALATSTPVTYTVATLENAPWAGSYGDKLQIEIKAN